MKKICTFFLILIISMMLTSCSRHKSSTMFTKSHQMINNALSIFKKPVSKKDPEIIAALPTPKNPIITSYLVVIFDNSESMKEPYSGLSKLQHARQVLKGLNNALPDAPFISKFQTFSDRVDKKPHQTIAPMARHDRQTIAESIESNAFGSSKSPLAKSLDTCLNELKGSSGNVAIVIITDGKTFDPSPIEAAKILYHELGPRLGIYPILVGNASHGKRLLKKMARTSVCGYVQRSKSLMKQKRMHQFLHSVLYAPKYRRRDRDRDGVKDPMDDCPTTPKGNVVDSRGCSPDSDGDSISDDRDECPDTPAGVTVASNGCPPADSDNDGVLDIMDSCQGTPAGLVVDASGCTDPDQDHDGVINVKDQCPKTPPDASVDSRGCWVIPELQFSPGKWELDLSHKSSLQEVIEILSRNPNLKIEIQGHTDNTGSEVFNQKISSYRAMSVMKYLMKNGVRPFRMSFKGYGSERPIVPNNSPENRAYNRRIQFMPKYSF